MDASQFDYLQRNILVGSYVKKKLMDNVLHYVQIISQFKKET